ncbi:MAG: aldose 1-epimerase family protein [Bacteroidota bacterium]
MQQFSIENEQLKVAINLKGGELASIVSKQNSKEYMWQANPKFWGRHSCILFPIIGKLYENRYQLEGETYELGQHGFVRDRIFDVVANEGNAITFRYESTEEDKKLYPYAFAINMIYSLQATTLSVKYEVENREKRPISFSIGGHPAFNCPLNADEKRSGYTLIFEKEESAESHLLNENGLFDGKTKKIFDGSDRLPINENLFDEDALIFKNLKSTYVSLENQSQEKILTFHFEGFPYLGIWSKNRASTFVCIEPWFGIADKVGGQEDFHEKEGNQSLGAGKVFDCEHKITIHQ